MPRGIPRTCEHCGREFRPNDRMLSTDDGVTLCESCFESYTSHCPGCREVHYHDEDFITIDGESYCGSCEGDMHYVICDCCGNNYTEGVHRTIRIGADITDQCRSCRASYLRGYGGDFWVHDCDGATTCIHSTQARCEVCEERNPHYTGVDSPSAPTGYTRPFTYHRGPARVRPATTELCCGFEFEVCGTDVARQWRELAKLGIRADQIHPEMDSSVDIEWVTQPIPKSQVWDFVRKVCKGLRNGGAKAYDAPKSCGAHHNIDKGYLNDRGWDTAVKTVHRFYQFLASFSGPQRRFSYCRDVRDLEQAQQCRGAVNFPSRPAVEFRLPGMTLAPNMMATQVSLYLNMVDNIKAGISHTAGFAEIFGPISEEMAKCIQRKGFDPTTGLPVERPTETQAPGLTFDRQWGEFRVGDVVRVRSLAEISEYHEVPADCYSMSIPYERGRTVREVPEILNKIRVGMLPTFEKILYPVTAGVPTAAEFTVVITPNEISDLRCSYTGTGRTVDGFEFTYEAHTLRVRMGSEELPTYLPTVLFELLKDSSGRRVTMDPRFPRDRLSSGSPIQELISEGRALDTGSGSQRGNCRTKLSEDSLDEDISKWDSSTEDNSQPISND